jgi:hypothetical protein
MTATSAIGMWPAAANLGALSDGAIRRFANNLLRHDLGIRVDRRLYPSALRQGDCRSVGDVHRGGSGAGLMHAAWLEG